MEKKQRNPGAEIWTESTAFFIITARKRSCGKEIFSAVFVCPEAGGGFSVSVQECLCLGDLCPGGSLSGGLCLGDLCPGGVSVKGVSVWGSLSGGSLSRGGLCQGGFLSRGSLPEGSLSRGPCPGGLCPGVSLSGRPTYGNERAVHILLEFILVFTTNHEEADNYWVLDSHIYTGM